MSQQPDYILRLPDVLQRTGLSRTMLYELIGDGKFPKQIKIGKRSVGWKSSLVDGWIEQQPQA